MADLTKPTGMSDELWEDITDDFNGEYAVESHKKYFTVSEGDEEEEVTQEALETWYEAVQLLAPDATSAVELEYKTLHQDDPQEDETVGE